MISGSLKVAKIRYLSENRLVNLSKDIDIYNYEKKLL